MRYNEPNLATSASPHATEVRMTMIIVPWTKVINSIFLEFFAQDAYFPLFFMIVGKVFVHQESAGCSAWQVPIVKIVSNWFSNRIGRGCELKICTQATSAGVSEKRSSASFYWYSGHFLLFTCWREGGGQVGAENTALGFPTQTSTLPLDSNVEPSSGVSLRITTIDVVSNPYE